MKNLFYVPLKKRLISCRATCIIGSNKFYYDVIYNPVETFFLKEAKKFGNKVENGKKMFIYQAHQAFAIWHNVFPKIDEEVEKLLD